LISFLILGFAQRHQSPVLRPDPFENNLSVSTKFPSLPRKG